MTHFHGSYLETDVEFLMKQIDIDSTDIDEKEKLIQSGQKHYSEMITKESLPTDQYMTLFRESVVSNAKTMARDVYRMAQYISSNIPSGEITLVSLARAGTPVGVLVKRVLNTFFDRDCKHYSVSIVRDRGIDEVAMKKILNETKSPESIKFIDGWTGKGVISRELEKSVSNLNERYNLNIDTGLYVLNDLAGTAAWCSSTDDYLIPSSILNATVSGLVSRSILNDQISESDYHGCLYYEEFQSADLSLWFIDQIMREVDENLENSSQQFLEDGISQWLNYPVTDADSESKSACIDYYLEDRLARAAESLAFMTSMQERFCIQDINLIKPGIGESTRVMLRRVPDLLLLKNPDDISVRHLLVLAKEKGVKVIEDSALLYNAVAIIKEVD